ncbi:hypothetical protein L3X38_005726 [Prunus dulcis]|nr:hypothetical protein L3X38_005726 [Prunus dulcis]
MLIGLFGNAVVGFIICNPPVLIFFSSVLAIDDIGMNKILSTLDVMSYNLFESSTLALLFRCLILTCNKESG